MFGVLKRLLGKQSSPASSADQAREALTARPIHQAAPPVESAPQRELDPTPIDPEPAADDAPLPSREPESEPSLGTIELPLQSVVDRLPAALREWSGAPGRATYALSVNTALAQLPTGVVKVCFGDLRAGSPAGIFSDNPVHDQTLVELPLSEIVPRINPELLTRRSDQKDVEVPDDVTGVFEGAVQLSTNLQVAAPKIVSAGAFKPPVPPPQKPPEPKIPAKPVEAAPKLVPLPKPELRPTPGALQEDVVVCLSEISEEWPESIQQQIAGPKAQGARVHVPWVRLEAAMKAGRAVFNWQEVAQWVRPTLPVTSVTDRDTPVVLPLRVVAPLFLARRTPVASQKAVDVPDEIPNLFSGTLAPVSGSTEPATKTGAPASSAPIPMPQPALRSPAPTSQPTFRPAMAPVGSSVAAKLSLKSDLPKPNDPLGILFGEPGKSIWTPQEIVQKTRALPGIAGALLARSDGAVIAADLPGSMNAQRLAAMLPQTFGRMSQCANELHPGELTHLIMEVDQVPFALFKNSAGFFITTGRAGENLPASSLRVIAAELAKRNP